MEQNAIVGQVPLIMANSRGDHYWQVCPCFICGYYRQLTVTLLSPLPEEVCKLAIIFLSTLDCSKFTSISDEMQEKETSFKNVYTFRLR